MKSTILYSLFVLVLTIILFLIVSNTKITFKPFSIKVDNPLMGIAIIFFVFGLAFFKVSVSRASYIKGFTEGAETMTEECIKILKEK
jgi:uncharacterized integral membrane protein